MSSPDWQTLLFLIAMMGLLLVFQRWLHFEIQAVFLLLFRRPQVAIGLFALLFLPGVFLHELSHFVAARLMGVRTGRFSVIPRAMGGGKLRMGFVETARTDVFRDALIGAAPLLVGLLVVGWVAWGPLHLGAAGLSELFTRPDAIIPRLAALPAVPDFWIWFYLAFAVSSTMFPSEADRRSWLPVALILLALLGAALLLGVGPWMRSAVLPRAVGLAGMAAAVLLLSLATHAVLLGPTWLARKALNRLTGLRITA